MMFRSSHTVCKVLLVGDLHGKEQASKQSIFQLLGGEYEGGTIQRFPDGEVSYRVTNSHFSVQKAKGMNVVVMCIDNPGLLEPTFECFFPITPGTSYMVATKNPRVIAEAEAYFPSTSFATRLHVIEPEGLSQDQLLQQMRVPSPINSLSLPTALLPIIRSSIPCFGTADLPSLIVNYAISIGPEDMAAVQKIREDGQQLQLARTELKESGPRLATAFATFERARHQQEPEHKQITAIQKELKIHQAIACKAAAKLFVRYDTLFKEFGDTFFSDRAQHYNERVRKLLRVDTGDKRVDIDRLSDEGLVAYVNKLE